MSSPSFEHIRLEQFDGVVVIKMLTRDIQGPEVAKAFIAELMTVVECDDCKPIVFNLKRAHHFSSMGYAALFKLVKYAKEKFRPVRFCDMHADVRVGADIVGLHHVVEIDDCQETSLKALCPA